MYEEMKDRIRMIMESQQMTQQEFAQKLGIPPSTLSSIFTGRTNPTNNHTQAIHKAFPAININWLMFGEGKMLVDASVSLPDNNLSDANKIDKAEQSCSRIQETTLFGVPPAGSVGENSMPKTAYPYTFNMAKNFDIKSRRIKEIRVFFDDGTYESFIPSK